MTGINTGKNAKTVKTPNIALRFVREISLKKYAGKNKSDDLCTVNANNTIPKNFHPFLPSIKLNAKKVRATPNPCLNPEKLNIYKPKHAKAMYDNIILGDCLYSVYPIKPISIPLVIANINCGLGEM